LIAVTVIITYCLKALFAAVSAQFQVKVLLHYKSAGNRMQLLAAIGYAQRGKRR
jgi:hypothetical protein